MSGSIPPALTSRRVWQQAASLTPYIRDFDVKDKTALGCLIKIYSGGMATLPDGHPGPILLAV
jgi:hypothetical protein